MTETDRSDGFFLPSLPNLPLLVTPLCQHPAPPARPACPTAGTSRKPPRAATWPVRPPHPGASRAHTHCSCSRVRDPGTGTWRPLPPADGDTEVPGEAAGPPGGRRCRVRTPCRSPPARPCCGRCLSFSRGGGARDGVAQGSARPEGLGRGAGPGDGDRSPPFPGRAGGHGDGMAAGSPHDPGRTSGHPAGSWAQPRRQAGDPRRPRERKAKSRSLFQTFSHGLVCL